MTSRFLRSGLAISAFAVVAACIPVRNEVSLSGSSFHAAQAPIAAEDGIVILGWNGPTNVAVRGRAGARYDDAIAACVRSALADASPKTRIVSLDQFRPAAGGVFATPDVRLTEEGIELGLNSASTSSAFAALRVRYLFMVEGATESSNFHSSGGGYAAQSSNSKRTRLRATAWDATTGKQLEAVETYAAGFENFTSVGLIVNVLEYAPTESIACNDMAAKVARYVSGGSDTPQ